MDPLGRNLETRSQQPGEDWVLCLAPPGGKHPWTHRGSAREKGPLCQGSLVTLPATLPGKQAGVGVSSTALWMRRSRLTPCATAVWKPPGRLPAGPPSPGCGELGLASDRSVSSGPSTGVTEVQLSRSQGAISIIPRVAMQCRDPS